VPVFAVMRGMPTFRILFFVVAAVKVIPYVGNWPVGMLLFALMIIGTA